MAVSATNVLRLRFGARFGRGFGAVRGVFVTMRGIERFLQGNAAATGKDSEYAPRVTTSSAGNKPETISTKRTVICPTCTGVLMKAFGNSNP